MPRVIEGPVPQAVKASYSRQMPLND
jgi:hypothetical protein